jgi:hypothetical protein
MGHQVIKQPNGLLAIYSSGVDAWLRWDMTPQDVEDYYVERAIRDTKESIERLLTPILADNPREAYYQFAMTFAEANAHSRAGQGGDEGPEGPVDEALMLELQHPEMDDDEALADTMDNHLIFGAGFDKGKYPDDWQDNAG